MRLTLKGVDAWGFGVEAERYASAVPAGVPAIVVDASNLETCAEALALTAERKKTGKTFYTSILLDDTRSVVANRFALPILQQIPTLDQRRTILDQLAAGALTINGQPQAGIPAYDPRFLETMRDVMVMGEALLCRSWRERDRLRTTFGRTRPFVATMPGRESLPAIERADEPDAIVIWAPRRPAAEAAILAFALEELTAAAFLVCQDGVQLPLRARSVRVEEAREALSRAALIVDASFSDAGAALAWADRGQRVVAAVSTGAEEYLDGVETFDAWDWRSILRAVTGGLTLTPPRRRESDASVEARLVATLRAAEPPRLEHEPLVTIVIPTLNRPLALETAIACLAAQRYENVEVIVINDGGEPVDDVVARFPIARALNPGKIGMVEVQNLGVREARGKYIGFLADDDIYYPDQITRLAYALETTGADVAHSNNVIRFVEKELEGVFRPFGFKVVWDAAVDATTMLTTSSIAGQSYLWRADGFARHGGVKPGIDAQSDYEIALRWHLGCDFVHVDFVTNEWLYRQDPEQFNVGQAANMATDLEKIFATFPTDRPAVRAHREAHLNMLRAQQPGSAFWTPAIRLAPHVATALPRFVLRAV